VAFRCGAVWSIMLAMIAGLCLGAARARPVVPPSEVVKAAHALYFDDIDVEAAFRPRPVRHQTQAWLRQGVLRPVGLSGAGTVDWLIDVNRAPSSWLCGTGGCPLQIWVRPPAGPYAKAFDARVRTASIRRAKRRGQPYLLVDFHGSHCGLTGVEACPFAFRWDARDGFIESARFTRTTVVRGASLPQAMEARYNPRSLPLPAQLNAVLASQKAACRQHGGALSEEGIVSRLPDMNGDGVREWRLEQQYGACDYPRQADGTEAAASDDCRFLQCRDLIFLSRKTPDGQTTWGDGVDTGPQIFGFEIHADGRFLPVTLAPRPGHGPDSDAPCTSYYLAGCTLNYLDFTPATERSHAP